MKKILLFAMLLTSLGMAAKERQIGPRHSLEITIGDPFIAELMSGLFSYKNYADPDMYYYDKADIWTGNYTIPYHKSSYTTPAINLTYHYAVRRWLHVGAKLSYFSWGSTYNDRLTQSFLYKEDTHFFSAMADVRFQYYNRRVVKIYSGVALGVGLGAERYNGTPHIIGAPAWQATLFGLSAGRKAYFNMELGAGVEGFGKIGFGYRF